MERNRRNRIYDHRLVQLVQDTGDINIATGLGVPRSTAAGWLRRVRPAVTTAPCFDDTGAELRARIARLEKRVQLLRAIARVMFAVLTTVIRFLDGTRIYLHTVIDNYCYRRILSWRLNNRFDP